MIFTHKNLTIDTSQQVAVVNNLAALPTEKRDRLKNWATELVGGTYAQGQHALRCKDDTFCCLGVACDLAQKDVNGRWDMDGNNDKAKFVSDTSFSDKTMDINVGYLPKIVKDYFGFDDIGGFKLMCYENGQSSASGHSLASLNDFDIPFKTIGGIMLELIDLAEKIKV